MATFKRIMFFPNASHMSKIAIFRAHWQVYDWADCAGELAALSGGTAFEVPEQLSRSGSRTSCGVGAQQPQPISTN